MTCAACILLPLLLAMAQPWMPPLRWLVPAVAALTAALAVSLPWTGGSLGGWILADPLAIHVAILCALAWLAASVAAAIDTHAPPPAAAAAMVGCMNLALLADGVGLTVLASGGAALAACTMGRPGGPGPLLTLLACALGLAVFGLAVLGSAMAAGPGPGWVPLSWGLLPGVAARADGLALGVAFVAMLSGLGCACTLLPIWAAIQGVSLPRTTLMLAGPLGGTWLVTVLRLRGVLDGNGHAMAPGGVMVATGLAGLALSAACLRSRERLLPACLVAMLGASLLGFGLGGPAATGAGLLHLTLGCLALVAAATGAWPATLGLASLAGLPPFGLFASGFALLTAALAQTPLLTVPLGVLLALVAIVALRRLPPPGLDGAAARIGWVGLVLSLVGGWAMPPGIAAWLQGIAAAAR